MDREKIVRVLIHIVKKVLKWFLILLAIAFTIIIFIIVYLLVAQYFYDGETLGLA